jgi:hypothetical protein
MVTGDITTWAKMGRTMIDRGFGPDESCFSALRLLDSSWREPAR